VEGAREAILILSDKRGWYENHDNMVKHDFDPLFERLAKLKASHPTLFFDRGVEQPGSSQGS
jgi:hypothetical protein